MAEMSQHLKARSDTIARIFRGLFMKKLLVIAVTLAALGGGAANAADLPNIKGPPIFAQPPASPTWTGFYTRRQRGVHVGC